MKKIVRKWEVWNTGLHSSCKIRSFRLKKDAVKYAKNRNKDKRFVFHRFHIRVKGATVVPSQDLK